MAEPRDVAAFGGVFSELYTCLSLYADVMSAQTEYRYIALVNTVALIIGGAVIGAAVSAFLPVKP